MTDEKTTIQVSNSNRIDLIIVGADMRKLNPNLRRVSADDALAFLLDFYRENNSKRATKKSIRQEQPK